MRLVIEYPKLLPDAMQQTRAEFEHEAKMAMAVKLFEMKRLSSGMAARLAGIDRVTFLLSLHRFGVAMIDLDEVKFENILNNSIIKIGFEDTLFKVIYPLLNKIGILWQIGTITPVHEHFISNLIRQKLFAAIDGLPIEGAPDNKTFLLVLPQWELHDIGLLVYNYLIRKKGHKTIFLGQGVPLHDLEAINEMIKPEAIVTSFSTSVHDNEISDYLQALSGHYPGIPVYVGGIQSDKICANIPSMIHKVPSIIDFRDTVLEKL